MVVRSAHGTMVEGSRVAGSFETDYRFVPHRLTRLLHPSLINTVFVCVVVTVSRGVKTTEFSEKISGRIQCSLPSLSVQSCL